jgi:fluoroquinolone transport system permease protein
MQLSKALTNLSRNDARVISRDSFLITMVVYIVGMAVVLRFALPWLNDLLIDSGSFALEPFYPMAIAFIAVFNGALIGGTMIGFVLLDEREDHTIKAMLVTPLPLPVYVGYRVLLPMVIGFVLVLAQLLLLNPLAALPVWQIAGVALGAGMTAPIAALFFASFADNKVQGFALMKFTGIGGFLIGGAWFVEEPLQWLFGLFPPYWISKAYWMALEARPLWWAALLAGIVLQGVLIAWLIRRFQQVAYKGA